MRRDELRLPLKKRSLRERLWARRPSALQVSSFLAIMAFSGFGTWLARTPAPFAGEPVVVLSIPVVEEIKTASVDKAPAPEPVEEIAEAVQEADFEPMPDETVAIETDTAIIVSPRRSLPPAPIAAVSEKGPYGPLPRIGSNSRKPSDVYARRTPDGIIHSDRPKIALILGGMGINAELTAKAIKELPGEITFGFAPYGENLQATVNKARAKGHEIMLQLPMEPFGYPGTNPGPKTLIASADKNANLDSLTWHMAQFAGYTGIMNYMGARFLSDAAAMKPVLTAIKQRGLIYLDENSAGQSKASEVAKAVGLKARQTTTVIDSDADPESIAAALDRLEDEARRDGFAVGSGAGLGVAIETVAKWAKTLADRGIVLVPVSAAYRGRTG